MIKILITLIIGLNCFVIHAQTPDQIEYPFAVEYIDLNIEGNALKMAYMDVVPEVENGKTVLFLHGKNFTGYYWDSVMTVLNDKGYRVIAPDQIGWGKSSVPDIHYSFHLLAKNTKQMLDEIGISKVYLIGHSMGGMLATRFALMYPEMVEKLILENPIGLEDYKTFVPYTTIDEQFQKELSATYDSYKKYQQTYYPEWKPEYEDLVKVQAAALNSPDFRSIALANAITYEMIYEQPVVYEFENLKVPLYFIIGNEDRTIVGKNLLSVEQKEKHGRVLELAREISRRVPGTSLTEFPDVGHIPHIQVPGLFINEVLEILTM